MKKFLLLSVSSIFFLSGCGSQPANDVANPYEIKIDSEILSIYDDQTKFEENGFKSFYDGISLSADDDYIGFINYENDRILIDDDAVTYMTIFDENIVTYKSISPGDDTAKIEEAFENNNKYTDENDEASCSYTVFFDENGKDLKDEDINTSKAYSISYETSNAKIEYITICIEHKE